MLNPFPQLLLYGFFAPTLLRLCAGLALLYIAYTLRAGRKEITQTPMPVVGRVPEWAVWLAGFVVALTGIALILGYYTQWATIIGAVVALKQAAFSRRYSRIIPLSTGANLLLLAICLSLLLSGAGAFAFDLPL